VYTIRSLYIKKALTRGLSTTLRVRRTSLLALFPFAAIGDSRMNSASARQTGERSCSHSSAFFALFDNNACTPSFLFPAWCKEALLCCRFHRCPLYADRDIYYNNEDRLLPPEGVRQPASLLNTAHILPRDILCDSRQSNRDVYCCCSRQRASICRSESKSLASYTT